MKRLREGFVVLFLLFIVIFLVSALWRDGLRGEESGRTPGSQEKMSERKLDDWVPLMP